MLRQQGLKGCLACAAHGRYRIFLMTRQGIKGSNIDLDGVRPVLAARQELVFLSEPLPVIGPLVRSYPVTQVLLSQMVTVLLVTQLSISLARLDQLAQSLPLVWLFAKAQTIGMPRLLSVYPVTSL